MQNKLLELVNKRKLGINCGVPSFCCANKIVIESILRQSRRFDDTVLIEGTSNQVNQFGGYTGMTPNDFVEFVYSIADKNAIPHEKIIIGGDHLGPLPWCDKPEKEAMEKAKELVRLSVLAGYQKIHLDTSMRLGDDNVNEPLDVNKVARRGALLYKECEQAFSELLKRDPNAVHPVYVIGSEVPIPGGIQSNGNTFDVTKPEAFKDTLEAYKKEFLRLGINDAWVNIIAIVVQPGVEFGNEEIVNYNRFLAKDLTEALKEFPNLVFEGHSTDYQSPIKLREMVEDGIAIIKVGPALSFALREGLFALSEIEKYLIPEEKRANFAEKLESVMLEDTSKWVKHYVGNDNEKLISRKFSFSDRCRYYFNNPIIEEAIDKLFKNIDSTKIPLGLLHQYLPFQYVKVRDNKLTAKAKDLVEDNIITIVDDYNFAVKFNYITSSIFIK